MNEEIALALDKNKISLHLLPYETPHFSEKMDRRLLKLSPFFEPNQETVNFHIRHQWPPNFKKPPQGDLILMQPWEFGSLPIEWVDHSSDVREFWAYSSFVKKIYSLSGIPEEKIFIIPGGIGEQFVPGGEKIDLPTKKSFRFLYVGGLIPRKGFDLLLRAYLEEFKPEEDVCLVVRDFYYASQWKEEIKNLSQRKDIPEILHYTTYLLPFQIPNLYRACHVYVHPYRGEGFGLPILEAMACGLPTITTGFGAALDFCHSGNAYLIPAKLSCLEEKHIGEHETIDFPFWAEPDLETLKKLMRRLFLNRMEACHRGLLASQEISREWTWNRTAEIIAKRLESLKHGEKRDFPLVSPTATRSYVQKYNEMPISLEKTGEGKASYEALKGWDWLEKGELEKAEVIFSKLISLQGWAGEGFYGMAQIAQAKNEKSQALTLLEKAVEVYPYHILAWRHLAKLADSLGLFEKAFMASLESRRGLAYYKPE